MNFKRTLKYCLGLIIGFLLLSSALIAKPLVGNKVYFIAVNGNDANLGTENSPWASIFKAAEVAVAGDTVLVKAGTYSIDKEIVIKNSGNSVDGFITFKNYGDDEVIFDGSADVAVNPGNPVFTIYKKNYIRVEGFHITNHTCNGIMVHGPATHIEIRNNTISNQKFTYNRYNYQGHALIIYAWNKDTEAISHLTIENNELYNNITGVVGGGYNETLTIIGEVSHFNIKNNYIHDNYFIGLDFIGGNLDYDEPMGISRHGVIEGNILSGNGSHDEWCSGFYGDGLGDPTIPDGIIIKDNISFDNAYCGFELGNEHSNTTCGGVLFTNNISYKNGHFGLTIGGSTSDGRHDNFVERVNIYNNVGYKNKKGEVLLTSPIRNINVKNNIFRAVNTLKKYVSALDMSDSDVENAHFDYNLWYRGDGWLWANGTDISTLEAWQATGNGAHSIEADPMFANATEFDFHLKSSSPAIDAGIDVGLPFIGLAPNMGAYEIIDTPPPPTDTTKPNSINNKTIQTKGFKQLKNYPNPFSQSTNISFELSDAGFIKINIYNTNGQEIINLAQKNMSAGKHRITWNSCDNKGNPQPSGIYFCRISGNIDNENILVVKKVLLVR